MRRQGRGVTAHHRLVALVCKAVLELVHVDPEGAQDNDGGAEEDAENEPLGDDGRHLAPRRSPHDVLIHWIDAQALRGWSIHENVDEEDLHRVQWQLEPKGCAERDERQ